MFFFEKKNQKTFGTWRTWPGWRVHQSTKVFRFFSSEKKTFLPFADLVLIVATALWGAAYLITHTAMQEVSPLPFVSLRFLTAALTVSVLTRPAMARVSGVELRGAAAIGLAMLAGYALQAAGLQTLSSGQAAFISALYVPIVPMLQILVLRRLPGALVWVSAALATAGMMLMAGHAGAALSRGDAFALGGACAIAAEITLVAMFAPRADPRRLAVTQCAFVGVSALVLSLVTGASLPAFGLWVVCAAGLGVLSAYLQITTNWAMRTIPATRATLIFALEPVWASLFGALAGERMSRGALVGAALILAALVVSARRRVAVA
jgi:drug/metabolite transporter (DMT)-like permease